MVSTDDFSGLEDTVKYNLHLGSSKLSIDLNPNHIKSSFYGVNQKLDYRYLSIQPTALKKCGQLNDSANGSVQKDLPLHSYLNLNNDALSSNAESDDSNRVKEYNRINTDLSKRSVESRYSPHPPQTPITREKQNVRKLPRQYQLRKSSMDKTLIGNSQKPSESLVLLQGRGADFIKKPLEGEHIINSTAAGQLSDASKATKIFLSQKQSPDIQSSNSDPVLSFYPSAPPGTPSVDMLKKFEYVPSLSDNMAKQKVKTKLKFMKKIDKEKDKVAHQNNMKLRIKAAKENDQDIKRQQRRIIYALNTVMTASENEQFEKFRADNGLKPKEYPNPRFKLI